MLGQRGDDALLGTAEFGGEAGSDSDLLQYADQAHRPSVPLEVKGGGIPLGISCLLRVAHQGRWRRDG